MLTRNGTGYKCSIYPGQKLFGAFFLFFDGDLPAERQPEEEYKAAADEYDGL